MVVMAVLLVLVVVVLLVDCVVVEVLCVALVYALLDAEVCVSLVVLEIEFGSSCDTAELVEGVSPQATGISNNVAASRNIKPRFIQNHLLLL